MSGTIQAWSYSRWSLWDRCPAAFKYKNIDKLPEPQNDAAKAGDLLHRSVEQYIVQPPNGSIPVPLPFETHFGDLVRAIRALPRKMAEMQLTYRRDWTATGWMAKDAWWRNKLDVFAVTSDETAEVVDWKGGKKHPEHEEQLETYGLAALLWKRTIETVKTRMIYVDSGEETIYDFTRNDIDGLKAKWKTRADALLAATEFPPRPNHLCDWCHFRASNGGPCRFG